jgi:hypothetical protein
MTELPRMHMQFSCSGSTCDFGRVFHDGEVFACESCGTWWWDEEDEGHAPE